MFQPLISFAIKAALIVGAFCAVLWAIAVLVNFAFVWVGGLLFLYAVLVGKRRLIAGLFVGYGIYLSSLLIARILKVSLARDTAYVWASHDAADVARFASWTSQHHLVSVAGSTLVLVGFVVGLAMAPGAAGWRLPIKDANGNSYVDESSVINRLIAGVWALFPWSSRINAWRDVDGNKPPRSSNFSLSPHR